MNINATLLVQMCHFVLGYVILKTLVFKPVYAIIIQNNLRLKAKQKNIDGVMSCIESVQEARMHAWRMHCDFYRIHKPIVLDTIVEISTIEAEIVGDIPSADEMDGLSEEIASMLTKRIVRDYQ